MRVGSFQITGRCLSSELPRTKDEAEMKLGRGNRMTLSLSRVDELAALKIRQ